jgi:putative intracellular protease/amidase
MSAQFSGLGAIVTVRPVGTLHVVRDGALITAQNPRSAVAGAAALLSALAET